MQLVASIFNETQEVPEPLSLVKGVLNLIQMPDQPTGSLTSIRPIIL